MTIKKGTSTIASNGYQSWGSIEGEISDQVDLKNALDLKSTILSPSFTGIPTAPTASEGTNTTQIATTEFVKNAVDNIDALPDQTDMAGKYLTTDGFNSYWKSPAGLPLFASIWSDHLLNDGSYLRADTFSWQNGNMYTSAYNHLEDEIINSLLASLNFYIAYNDSTSKYCLYIKAGSVGVGPSGNSRTVPSTSLGGDPGIYGSSSNIGEEFYGFISLDSSGNFNLEAVPTSEYYIQNTAPSSPAQYAFWYDTTSNTIKHTFDSGTQWYGDYSYPLCKFVNRGNGFSGTGDLLEVYGGYKNNFETIGSYTIGYYKAADGHKIVSPDDETTVQSIYNESGISWYYILDTTNKRFKLPRTKFGFTGYRDGVGNYVEAGLPNITGTYAPMLNGTDKYPNDVISSLSASNLSGAFTFDDTENGRDWHFVTTAYQYNSNSHSNLKLDASRSSSIYGNSSTVQPPATQMYLYFYVGNTVRNETEIDVGEITEALDGKLDQDLSNASANFKETIVGYGMPDYSATITVSYPYTAICDGIANVYGASSGEDTVTVNGNGIGCVFQGVNGVTVLLNRGDILNVTGSQLAYIYFIPLKGANNA